MKLAVSVRLCLDCSRFVALLLSLFWLFLVTRYFEIKPEYASREYLKNFQDAPKNQGMISMKTISTRFHGPQIDGQQDIHSSQQFVYFTLHQLSQSKSRINCQKSTHVLVINANFKEVSDSYLTLFKEIERESAHCVNSLFELNRKSQLFLNSKMHISNYAMEIALTIFMLLKQTEHQRLSIVTFEEGCALLIKSFQFLTPEVINMIGDVIMINAYNPNFEILGDMPYKFIKQTQSIISEDRRKMQALNQTKMIFISTGTYWDQISYQEQDQSLFNFLWDDKKMYNTLFLNTRTMRNLYNLYDEKDYFSYSSLASKLAKFLIFSKDGKKIQMADYYFNQGEVYTHVNSDFKQIKNKMCLKGRLSTLNKITRVLGAPCLQIDIQTKMKEKTNQSLLFVTSRKSCMFNEKYEEIMPVYENTQSSYYIFDHVKTTREVSIINPDKSDIYVEFHTLYGPLSNPLPDEQIFSYSPNTLFYSKSYKQNMNDRKLIKVCPSGSTLIYPEHFHNIFSGSTQLTVYAIHSINKLIYDFHLKNSTEDCYPDLSTQVNLVPLELRLNWPRQRAILIFLLLCSQVSKLTVFNKFYMFLMVLCILHRLHTSSWLILLSLLMISACIAIQKCIDIVLHLVKYIQDVVEIKYRKLMLTLIFMFTLLKVGAGYALDEFHNLSAWKLLCISLIFVVNRHNILVLVIKLYFLSDHIIYNHSDLFEMFIVLIWIYMGLEISKSSPISDNAASVLPPRFNLKVRETPTLQLLLICLQALVLDGPAFMSQIILNGYIIMKSMLHLIDKSRQIDAL